MKKPKAKILEFLPRVPVPKPTQRFKDKRKGKPKHKVDPRSFINDL